MNNKDVQLKMDVYTGVITGIPLKVNTDFGNKKYFTEIFVDTDYVGMCKQIWGHLNKEYINEDYITDIVIYDLDELNYKENKDYIDNVTKLFKTYFKQENIPNNIETIQEIIFYFIYDGYNVTIHTKTSEIEINDELLC